MTRSRDKSGRRRYGDREYDSNKGSDSDPDWEKNGLDYYKCEKCLRKFSRKCSYLRHRQDAGDCRLARERDFDDNDDFPSHKRARKDLNNSRFPESDPEDGEDSDDDWPVKCILCEQPFKTVDELSKHIETDHNDDNENPAPEDPPPQKTIEPKRPKENKTAETKPIKEDYAEMIDFEVPLAKYSQVPIRMPKKFQKAKIRAKEIDMEIGKEEKPKFAPKFKVSVKETKGAVTPNPLKKSRENDNKSPTHRSDVRSPTGRKSRMSPTIEEENEDLAAENNNEISTVHDKEQTQQQSESRVAENGEENEKLDEVAHELGCDNEQESAAKAFSEAASLLDDIDLNVTKTSQNVNEEEEVNLDDYFDTRRSLPSPPPPPPPPVRQPTVTKHTTSPASSAFMSHAHTYAKSSMTVPLSTSLKDLIKGRPKKMNFAGNLSKFANMPGLRLALASPNAQVRLNATNALKALTPKKPVPRLVRPITPITSRVDNFIKQTLSNQASSPNLSNVNRKVYKPATTVTSIKVGDTLITKKSLPQIISNEVLPPNHNLLKGIKLVRTDTNKFNLSSGTLYLNPSPQSSPVAVVRNESASTSTPNQTQINRPVNVSSGNSGVNTSTSSPVVARSDNVILTPMNTLPVVTQIANQKPGVVVLRTPGAVLQGALPNITLRNNAVVHNETSYSPTSLQPPALNTLVSSLPRTPNPQFFSNAFVRPAQSMSGNNTPYSTASPILYYGSNTVQSQPQATTQFYQNQGNGFIQIRQSPPTYITSTAAQQPSNTSYAYTPVYSSSSNITVRNPSPSVIIRNSTPNLVSRDVAASTTIVRQTAPRKIIASGTASIPSYSNTPPSSNDNYPLQVVLKLVRCPSCPKTFATKSGLRHHFKKNHAQQIPTLPTVPSPPQYAAPTEVIEIDETDDRYTPEKSYLPPASSPMERPPPQFDYSNNQQEPPQRTTPLADMPSQPPEHQMPLQDHAYAYQGQTKNPSPPRSPSALVDAEEYIQKLILSKQKSAPQFQNRENAPRTEITLYSSPQNVQNSLIDQNAKQPEVIPTTGCATETANKANDDVIETIVID